VLVGAVLLGGIAKGIGTGGREQRGGRPRCARRGARDALRAPVRAADPCGTNPQPFELRAYVDLGRGAALGVARANAVAAEFPDGDTFASVRIRVTVRDPATSETGGHEPPIKARAEAELVPLAQIKLPEGDDGEYRERSDQGAADGHANLRRPNSRGNTPLAPRKPQIAGFSVLGSQPSTRVAVFRERARPPIPAPDRSLADTRADPATGLALAAGPLRPKEAGYEPSPSDLRRSRPRSTLT